MRAEEYVETLCIGDRVINVGLDDYGQSYFFEWVDADDGVNCAGCGSFNPFYLEEIYSYFGEERDKSFFEAEYAERMPHGCYNCHYSRQFGDDLYRCYCAEIDLQSSQRRSFCCNKWKMKYE